MKNINQDIFLCPDCKSEYLITTDNSILCKNCESYFEIENNKIIFHKLTSNDVADSFDKIKFFFKRFLKVYELLVKVLSPVCPTLRLNKIINTYVFENKVALNLGSGNTIISSKVLNVDVFSYDNVDIVCDIENLPFKNNTIDVIFNIAVLEHVENPEKVVAEIFRVLKKNGVVISFFPFIQAYHASPYDFSRRTFEGMKVLYREFDTIDLKSAGGPTSGLLWICQEWISLLFSFGIKPVYNIINILLMLITFPIKFLDFFLVHHPMSKNISSGFLYIGRKL